jgi:hypothetical protein
MSRQVVVKNAVAAHLHCHEDEQHQESNSDRNQKVTGHDSRSVIPDEGFPMLGGGSSSSPIPRVLGPNTSAPFAAKHRYRASRTVPSATRSSPQVMFSFTMRAMSWRISFGSAGRPPRDFQRQYSCICDADEVFAEYSRSRCQFGQSFFPSVRVLLVIHC